MDRMKAHLHLPFCNFIQLYPWNGGPQASNRKLAWMPRKHFKSTVCSIALVLWLLIHDRNTTICLMSAKEDNTKKWLRQIKGIIKDNGFFRKCFPEIRPGGKWDELEIEITRDKSMSGQAQASVTAATLTGGQASQHYSHLILDDPINEKMAQSPDLIEGAVERYEYIESLLKDWYSSSFLFVGTPYGRGDPMEYAKEQEVSQGHRLMWGIGALGEFECSDVIEKEHPYCIPNLPVGEPILPTEVPQVYLDYMKRKDLETYHLQYLCKPYDAGRNAFKFNMIREFIVREDGRCECGCHPDHDHDLRRAKTILTWDPAATEDKKNCRNAVCVMTEFRCGCRFFLDEWADWVEADDAAEKVAEFCNKWQPYLKLGGIETVGFQKMYKKTLESWQASGKIPRGMVFIDLKPNNRHKHARIKSQVTPVANGLWHIRPHMQPNKAEMNHMWELKRFPYGAEEDLIDAGFGYCEDAWADPRAHQVTQSNEKVQDLTRRNQARIKRLLAKEV